MIVHPGELIQIIRSIKDLHSEPVPFSIPILNSESVQIGVLETIDKSMCKLPEIVEKLTRWRRMFMPYFLTQFPSSVDRTRTWLEKTVIPSDDRVLFLIRDDSRRLIGNFGVCGIKPHTAELDNLIRGESGGDPKLIFFAEVAMLSWLYFALGIDCVVLHVFSNNIRTINLHLSVGFAETRRFELMKIKEGEDLRYLVSPTPIPFPTVPASHTLPEASPNTGDKSISMKDDQNNQVKGDAVDFDYIEMTMDRQFFELSNPWAKSIYSGKLLQSPLKRAH